MFQRREGCAGPGLVDERSVRPRQTVQRSAGSPLWTDGVVVPQWDRLAVSRWISVDGSPCVERRVARWVIGAIGKPIPALRHLRRPPEPPKQDIEHFAPIWSRPGQFVRSDQPNAGERACDRSDVCVVTGARAVVPGDAAGSPVVAKDIAFRAGCAARTPAGRPPRRSRSRRRTAP